MSFLARNVPAMTSIDPKSVAIGYAVRGAIAQAGMTQGDVAEATGMSLTTLSRRINGGLPFTWPELVAVAELVDISVSDLAANAERIAARTSEAAAS